MGDLTRGGIVAAALSEAGYDTTYAEDAAAHLNAELRRIYASWPWPFLQRRVPNVALAAGALSLDLGAGSGGVTEQIQKVRDPIYLYTSDRRVAGKARIRQLTGGPSWADESAIDPSVVRGLPAQFKVRATATPGRWSLIPYPFPQEAYLLGIDIIFMPTPIDPAAAGDGEIPIYPEDATMKQAVYAWALRRQRELDAADVADNKLAMMKVNDRVTYGSVDGTNDLLRLDESVFK